MSLPFASPVSNYQIEERTALELMVVAVHLT